MKVENSKQGDLPSGKSCARQCPLGGDGKNAEQVREGLNSGLVDITPERETFTHSHSRVPERDGDETDDSHFTVRGCKGSTRSHALKTSARPAPSRLLLTHILSAESLDQPGYAAAFSVCGRGENCR